MHKYTPDKYLWTVVQDDVGFSNGWAHWQNTHKVNGELKIALTVMGDCVKKTLSLEGTLLLYATVKNWVCVKPE